MQLKLQKLENVIFRVGPLREQNGLYKDGKLIPSSKLSGRINVAPDITDLSAKEHVSPPVFYLGPLYACWGNCITDNLKFLWPFINSSKHPEIANCKLAYSEVTLFGRGLPSNFFRILELLGIRRERLIKVSATTSFDCCYLADQCYIQDAELGKNIATDEYWQIVDNICEHCVQTPEKTPEKIYFTRSKWHRWEYGEQSIETAFQKAGFTIYSPENLSFDDMISILSHAKTFASTDGSCAHNSTFLKPGTETILIRKFDFFDNKYQSCINETRPLNVQYINAHCSFIFYDNNDKIGGPFFMYPSKELKNALHTNAPFPLLDFFKYLAWGFALHYGHLVGEFIRRHKSATTIKASQASQPTRKHLR